MTIYHGDEALDYLVSKIKVKDPAASSHWEHFHSDFDFKDGKFFGVEGFGSARTTFTGVRGSVHRVFQIPYRMMGQKYSDFGIIDKLAEKIFKNQNKAYDLSALRQVISLAYLNERKVVKAGGTTCVIGDGFGSMACLLLAHNKQRVVSVNLSKTLLMDLWQIKRFLGADFCEVTLITDKDDIPDVLSMTEDKSAIIAIEAQNHELIRGFPLDLAINIVSMQEMNSSTVNAYFADLSEAIRAGGAFYCCNREEKILPDGERVIFKDYPWHLSKECLADELCPWNSKFYNLKPPFYHDYDGPIRHRLVKF